MSVLIQLHYPNVFFIFLTIIFSLYIVMRHIKTKEKSRSTLSLLILILSGIISFVVILFPFLLYESVHQYEDLKGVLLRMIEGSPTGEAGFNFIQRFYDVLIKTLQKVLPELGGMQSVLLELVMIAVVVVKNRSLWNLFIITSYLLGIFAMALFRGFVFDHYLLFLSAFSFAIAGSFLAVVDKWWPRWLVVCTVMTLTFIRLFHSDMFSKGTHDISRTKAVTSYIAQKTASTPFSFALISTRSFSDLHHRYFYKINGVKPEPIFSKTYNNLFLVCESPQCPDTLDEIDTKSLPILCYEPHCQGSYGKIDLNDFSLVSRHEVSGASVILLSRK